MIKCILILVLFISGCSWVEVAEGPSTNERIGSIVDNILNYMDPWTTLESVFHQPLQEIQAICNWKDFIQYRECFIWELEYRKPSIVYSSLDAENIDILMSSLKKEIQYYPYYKKIDNFKYPDFQQIAPVVWVDCHIIASGEKQRKMSTTEFYDPEKITLSYSENIWDTLLGYFPSWSGSQIYDAKSYSWYAHDPDHPCLYSTFWPAIGNIVYAIEDSDLLYIFLKDSDGGWSGEFVYFIYVYNKTSKQLEVIADMWMWSGFFPFSQRYTEAEGTEKITEFYKNWPFLHEISYDERTLTGDSVTELLKKYIQ